MSTRYDLVIFGATGFTGKNTIKWVQKLSNEKDRSYTWAVAGRSESKILAVLKEMGNKIGMDLTQTPIIVADVNDDTSLADMAKQARIIINTSGPFAYIGEPVVKACIENGCHHVDVSGEPHFMEAIQLKYHKEAQEKGVYIVSACGFDSIPVDIGLMYLESQFEGTLNSVETYLSGGEVGGPRPGPLLNIGTFESAINGIGAWGQLRTIRAKLYPTALKQFMPKLNFKGPVHKCRYDNKYALPFLGADKSVMQRSQRYLYENEEKRPVQVGTYFCVESVITVFLLAIFGIVLVLMAQFKAGRNLIVKYPKLFSLGYFSKEGPSDEKMENTKFTTTLIGEGWSTKQDDPNAAFLTKPAKKMIAQVNGTNPAYGATCMTLSVCAMTILDDPSKLPNKGGVYSPGAAFYHTAIYKEMHENGLTFEIVSQ